MKFSKLEKNCKKNTDNFNIICKMAVLGNCATQHLSTAIKGYAYEEDIAIEIFDADYNQIDAQLIDNRSELYQFVPDFILLFLCSEKLYEEFCGYPEEKRKDFAENKIRQIEQYWNLAAGGVKYMFCNLILLNWMTGYLEILELKYKILLYIKLEN